MQNLWFYLALSSSVLWGISYCLSERILHLGFSPSFVLAVSYIISLPLYIAFSYSQGTLKPGFETLTAGGWHHLGYFIVMALTIAAGNILIYQSIALKNATISSMIEITYPLFTFLFAWLLFGQVQLTISTAFGAALIFAGVIVMFFKG